MILPPVPDSFYWSTEPWGAALRCRPLDDLAPHLFTTRQLSLSSDADYQQLARAVGVDRVVTLTQVHGATVAVVRRGAPAPAATARSGRARFELCGGRDCRSRGGLCSDADGRPRFRSGCGRARRLARDGGESSGCGAECHGAGVRDASDERRRRDRPQHRPVLLSGGFRSRRCVRCGRPRAVSHRPLVLDSSAAAWSLHERAQLRLNVAGANRDQLILAGVPEAADS